MGSTIKYLYVKNLCILWLLITNYYYVQVIGTATGVVAAEITFRDQYPLSSVDSDKSSHQKKNHNKLLLGLVQQVEQYDPTMLLYSLHDPHSTHLHQQQTDGLYKQFSDKRSTWQNLQSSWGKRYDPNPNLNEQPPQFSILNDFGQFSMYDREADAQHENNKKELYSYDDENSNIDFDDYASLMQLINDGNGNNNRFAAEDVIKKRAWKAINGAWGKRNDNKDNAANKREPAWNNLKGLWGKRGNWNKLSSTWGKKRQL